jgi:hypothetical protein
MIGMIRTQKEDLIPKMLAALALAGVIFAISANSANSATTFVVNDKFDSSDEDLTDNACDVAVLIAGDQCTLRAAIEQANTTSGADTINFNIPDDPSIPGDEVRTISPVSSLPEITGVVAIDGYTQGDATSTTTDDAKPNTLVVGNNAVLKVELDGSSAGNANGLIISAGSSTVRGLVINRFAGGSISGTGIILKTNGNNMIAGNFLGTDATGTADQGNEDGLVIEQNSSNNTIGGPLPEDRNVISGNGYGLQFSNSSSGNQVQGNYIGTKKNGTEALPNSADAGINVGGDNNVIGGADAGERNVISGNGQDGVRISGNGNQVWGNYIGTSANGTGPLGNGRHGVLVDGTAVSVSNNTIGGTTAGTRNVISANVGAGISIAGASSTSVQGNYVGTDKSGTADLGNDDDGVEVLNSSNNTIGDDDPTDGLTNAANTIAFNGSSFEDGVRIGGVAGGTGNRILSNSIFSNADMGIDLGDNGVTPNDPGDPDTGANNLQNFPVLTSARSSRRGTTIKGTLNSTASTTFTVQFFSGPAMDLEGKKFLGQKSVTTDASGNASFTFKTMKKIAGEATATATDAGGNTSEFSAAKKVVRRR